MELSLKVQANVGKLTNAKVICSERARIGRTNESQLKTVVNEMDYINVRISEIKAAVNHALRIEKNIETYLTNKKKVSTERLKEAIRQAGVVVPDADCEDIELIIKDKSAMVVNESGLDVNDREGAGYRTSLGVLMRHTMLTFQPDALQLIFFDEAFAPLSDESTDRMRDILGEFSKDVCIVGIEQHAVLFNGQEHIEYQVQKGADKITKIRRC